MALVGGTGKFLESWPSDLQMRIQPVIFVLLEDQEREIYWFFNNVKCNLFTKPKEYPNDSD
jgi:hypothetical protein